MPKFLNRNSTYVELIKKQGDKDGKYLIIWHLYSSRGAFHGVINYATDVVEKRPDEFLGEVIRNSHIRTFETTCKESRQRFEAPMAYSPAGWCTLILHQVVKI